MRRPARPRSAGSQKRGPSADARARPFLDVRDPAALAREEFVVKQQNVRIAEQRLVDSATPNAGPARGAGRPKARPRSAQARREALPGAEKEQCLELKRTANSLSEENTKTRTRLRVLEREMQRRDRLLRELALMKKTGQCIDMSIIEKLKEERNMLPIVRKKAQDVQQQVEEKEAEIRELKREPQFTRIIELQVEYATWQHEAKRLDSLLEEPSPEVNPAARQEIDVHEERVRQLEAELADAGERRTKVADELADMETDHATQRSEYKDQEKEFERQQELTRDVAIAFKNVLQKRKQVDQLQGEIEEMELDIKRCEEELQGAAEKAALHACPASPSATPLGRASVSQAACSGPLPTSRSHAASLLSALRHGAASRAGDGSVFAEFLRRDTDRDGILSNRELAECLAVFGISTSDYSPQELQALLALAPAELGSTTALRWLDLLVILDRSSASQVTARLPPVGPLRAACLRLELFAEDFGPRLCAAVTRPQVEAFFDGLGLDASSVSAWVQAWEAYGADGLLLRLPVSDVAMRQAEFDAWLARCIEAITTHRRESMFKEAMQTWSADMLLKEEQFRMICGDVLGLELSLADIEDLGSYMSRGNEGLIDGDAVLRLAERYPPVAR